MKKVREYLSLIALLACFTPLGTAYASDKQLISTSAKQAGATEYHLDNGFRVVFVPDKKSSQTAVNLVYFTGSSADPTGKTGLAHMVEHLLFNAETISGGASLISEMARRNIAFSATTSFERTLYTTVFSADKKTLNWLLREEAARMHTLKITAKDLAQELPVVLREKELLGSYPALALMQTMLPVVSKIEAYSRLPIGENADLASINVVDAQGFYRQHYQPDNALLVVTGKFAVKATLKQINKTFGRIELNLTAAVEQKAREGLSEQIVALDKKPDLFTVNGDSPLLTLIYPLTVNVEPKDVAVLSLLAGVLTAGPSSRLYKALVASGHAAGVSVMPSILKQGAVLQFTVIPNGNDAVAIEKAKQVLLAALTNISQEPISAEELHRVKAVLNNAEQTLQLSPVVLGLVLAESAAAGDWQRYFNSLERVPSITAEDVQTAALRYLQSDQWLEGRVQVDTKALAERALISDVIRTGSVNANLPFQTVIDNEFMGVSKQDRKARKIDQRIDRFFINESLAVALYAKKTAGRRVHGLWNIRFGTAKSLFGKRVLADVTTYMLAYGTNDLGQQQLQDSINRLGAQVSISPKDDRVAVSFSAPATAVPELLDIISNVLRQPALPLHALTEIKHQLHAVYQANAGDPSILARAAMTAVSNPYPVGDTRREPSIREAQIALAAIELQDVTNFHEDFYGANHGQLIVWGGFDKTLLRAQLEDLLDGWYSREDYERPPMPFFQPKIGKYYVATPNKPHGIYTAKLRLPIHGSSRDALALKLANQIFGGDALASRLSQRLRKQEGFSYSAASGMGFSQFEARGTLVINASYSPTQRVQLSAAVLDELALLASNGITEKELKRAKDEWLKRYNLKRLSESRIFGKLNLLLRLNRTMQFYAWENEQVAKLTLEQVNAALAKHIKPSLLLEVFADVRAVDGR